jgi:hypothetical protein
MLSRNAQMHSSFHWTRFGPLNENIDCCEFSSALDPDLSMQIYLNASFSASGHITLAVDLPSLIPMEMQNALPQITLGNITCPFSPSFEGNEALCGKKSAKYSCKMRNGRLGSL